jgi:hypothetical protein
MERDFKADTQLEIRLANERGADHYRYGHDWFHLTPEEEQVFAIDRARFPRMITAWSRYEIFIGLLEDGGFNAETKRERERHPEIVRKGVSIDGFQHFAKEYTDITFREAHAMYCKHEFWQVRNGIAAYTDEGDNK